MLLCALLMASIASTLACDACIDGQCHSRKTIVKGFQVTGQMALDRRHSVLYLQLNSNLNTAVYLTDSDLKIHLVQKLNTTGLAVDQENGVLYTAHGNKIYKRKYDNEIELASLKPHLAADLLFYTDVLYYTVKNKGGLSFFQNGELKTVKNLETPTITDFVAKKDDTIYFVSEKRVYKLEKYWSQHVVLVAEKEYRLAIDRNDDVYFVDASTNLIMKLNRTTGIPVEYAAYATGSVSQIVFDVNNTIIFHDSDDRTVNYWKPEGRPCSIHAPHEKYVIIMKEGTEGENEINAPKPESQFLKTLNLVIK